MRKHYFTSESVTEGHPDKLCDQISDRILDELLAQDPFSRCACEVTCDAGGVHIMGEITSNALVQYSACVLDVLRSVGYTREEYGFHDKQCYITCNLHRQSEDIALGVDRPNEEDLGAGDQGMMFGFACRETETLMPLPIELAHRLTKRLAQVRKDGTLPYLRPDGKAQVTVEYHNGLPVRVDTVVLSAQHDPEVSMGQLNKDLLEIVIKAALPAELLSEHTRILINPTGRFVAGGPIADAGLTGRKIIADTYGGYARHGGGAFSGKDPTKVDRSGAYMARYIAKNIVAASLADRCEIQLSYSIGVAQPTSVFVDTFGTSTLDDHILVEIIRQVFDMRPAAIIDTLALREPRYFPLASYGHMGREDLSPPWERMDMVDALTHAARERCTERRSVS